MFCVQIKVHSGRVVSLGIWDTAGAERFESLSRMYYNGAKAAVLCFDPCDRKSFDKLKFWVRLRTLLHHIFIFVLSEAMHMCTIRLHMHTDLSIGAHIAVLLQVEEVRETQPDCRIYIALTKCDQLEELPTVGTAQPDPDTEADDSTNGAAYLHNASHVSGSPPGHQRGLRGPDMQT